MPLTPPPAPATAARSENTQTRGAARAVLRYEPKNELMLEYRQVLQRAMKQESDDESSEDDDEEESEEEDDESDDEIENEHKSGDADVSPKKKPLAEVNHPVISQEEMQADLLKFGIRGTKEELINNLRWIKNNKPDAVGSNTRRSSVLPFEHFDYPDIGEGKEPSFDESKEDAKCEAK